MRASLPTSPRRTSLWGLFSLIVFFNGSCSAALDWNPNGLACDTQVINGRTDFCLAGYSCLVSTTQCVQDHTLAKGHVCSDSRQCRAEAVCPFDYLAGGGVVKEDGVQECAPACRDASAAGGFFEPDGCVTGQVCLPYLNSSVNDANKQLLGACRPSANCTAGSACTTATLGSGGICTPISTTAQACLVGCEIVWSTTQVYSDNCDNDHYCQPVGLAGQQQFACMYNAQSNSTNPLASIGNQSIAASGASCSLVEAPCSKGQVCSPQGTCAPYCQLTANQTSGCPTSQSCCPFKTFATSQTTGYCASACN